MEGYVFHYEAVIIVGLPIWFIIRIATLIIRKKSGKKILIGKEIMTNLFVLYILLLVGITLFPIEIIFGEGHRELRSMLTLEQRIGINIIPLRAYIQGFFSLKESNIGYYFFIRSILGNIILLMPFIGYLLMYKKELRSIKNVTITAFVISLSIELLQLLENLSYLSGISGRTVNVDDLILNTIGGILGYCIFKMIYKTKLRTYLNMN